MSTKLKKKETNDSFLKSMESERVTNSIFTFQKNRKAYFKRERTLPEKCGFKKEGIQIEKCSERRLWSRRTHPMKPKGFLKKERVSESENKKINIRVR